MFRKKWENGRAGFTLAELLIVVAIIAVLVGIAIPVFVINLERTEAVVCMANLRSARAELAYTRMTDPEVDLSVIMQKHQGGCPSGGQYRLQEQDDVASLYCSKHGSDIVEDLLYRYNDLLTSWKDAPDYAGSFLSNDEMRKCIYNRDGGWATLTYEGKDYYIQPFINKVAPANWDEAVIFANGNATTSGSWNTSLVYWDGQWYSGGKKSFSITLSNREDVKKTIEQNGWSVLGVEEYVIQPPKK